MPKQPSDLGAHTFFKETRALYLPDRTFILPKETAANVVHFFYDSLGQ